MPEEFDEHANKHTDIYQILIRWNYPDKIEKKVGETPVFWI